VHPLTDAFIKGRAKFKKITGKYYDNNKKPKAACDYGAMYWGVYGVPYMDEGIMEGGGIIANDFPELRKIVPLPCGETVRGHTDGEIRSVLIHLNDEHDGRSGWTDEKKAQWLEKSLTQ